MARADRFGKGLKYSLSVVLSPLVGDGAQFSVLQLLSRLDRNVFSISLIVRKAEGSALPAVPEHVEIIDLNAKRYFQALPRLASVLKARRPDLVWSVMYFNNIVTAAARAMAGIEFKLIFSEHIHLTEEFRRIGGGKAFFLKALMRQLYRKADLLVGVSQGVAGNLADELNLPPVKIRAIYNGVDLDNVRVEAKKNTPEVQWDDIPTFVAVGRLHEQKDYPTLIKAVVRVRKPVRVLILGEGQIKDELTALCQKMGVCDQIKFLGYQENPFRFMARAKALVLSSRFEGFGRVLVEAMACGRPVISTNCPEGPGEIVNHGKNGLLVPVGDSSALAEAIELIGYNDDLSNRLGNAAYQRAEDFSLDIAAKSYTEMFLSLLNQEYQVSDRGSGFLTK